MRSWVLEFRPFGKPRKIPNSYPYLLLGNSEFVQLLQIEPELGAGPEEMRQSQRTIAGDGALTVQDSRYPVRRHSELPAELGSTHVELDELFGEMLARMHCAACHGIPHLS
jgi:hypothetical protein